MGRRIGVSAISNQVRGRRLGAGMNQQELADSCGLTRQAISAIEAGHYIPNTAVALRLAQTLGCTVEALFQLPADEVHVEAELLSVPPPTGDSPLRVHVARVGERLLASPLFGGMAATTAADGLIGALEARTAASRPTIDVELLLDRGLLEHAVVVHGCDPALALLGSHLSRRHPSFRLVWVHRGSVEALRGLARGETHAAGTHLRDPETGAFNIPYVQRELSGRRVVVITLSEWEEGLILAPGNPKGIASPADLARPDVTIVNREPGSGSRMLLESFLARHGVSSREVHGYDHEAATHLAVAETVASGAADAGPGIRSVARALGLDFLSLQQERYDLVVPMEFLNHPPLQAMLDVAMSPPYRKELEALGGYDSSRAGSIVAELVA